MRAFSVYKPNSLRLARKYVRIFSLSADFIFSEKRTVFRETVESEARAKLWSSRNRVMSSCKGKYLCIFEAKWRLLLLLSFKYFPTTSLILGNLFSKLSVILPAFKILLICSKRSLSFNKLLGINTKHRFKFEWGISPEGIFLTISLTRKPTIFVVRGIWAQIPWLDSCNIGFSREI